MPSVDHTHHSDFIMAIEDEVTCFMQPLAEVLQTTAPVVCVVGTEALFIILISPIACEAV